MLKPHHIVKLSRSGSVAHGEVPPSGRSSGRPAGRSVGRSVGTLAATLAESDRVLPLAHGLRRLCELAYAPTPDITALGEDALAAAALAQRDRTLTVEASAQLALSLSHLCTLLARAKATSPERVSLQAQSAAFWEHICQLAERADGAPLAQRLGELGRLNPALRKVLAQAELSASVASPLGSIGFAAGRHAEANVAPAAPAPLAANKLPASRRNAARTRAA